MDIIKTSYFKSNLKKGQIQALAFDDSKDILNNSDPLEAHIILKKAKLYLDTLMKENEKNALLSWEQHKDDFENVTYNQGGVMLNLDEFPYRKRIAEHLKHVDESIKKAFKSEDPITVTDIITGEILLVPKVTIKSFRKESLNVRL